MKAVLRKIFSPILNLFEKGPEPAGYKPSHRMVLNVVGVLFLVLSLGSGYAASYAGDPGFFFPVVIFFLLGFVTLIVGLLGTNTAVSKMWGGGK